MAPTSREKTVITGGPVLALDGGGAGADAVAVDENGRIAGVGSRADMEALAGRGARMIDVAGATVMPGLIDTHPHLLHFAAREYSMVKLFDARNHDDIVERIRERAAVTPKGQWILCTPVGEPHYFVRRSWRDLDESRLPDRHVLDRATQDHPVHIQAWAPTTPNVCAFNSAGLVAVGLSDFIPDRVCDVWLDKDDDGRLTGVLRGSVNNYYTIDPFWTQVLLKMPGPAAWDLHDSVIEAMADYNAQGVTCVYEAHNMRANHVEAYQRLRDEAALTVRVMAAMDVEPYAYPPIRPASIEAFQQAMETGLSLIETSDPMLKVTGMSFSPAAPLGPGMIRMHEAYNDPFGNPTRGLTVLTEDKLDAFIRFCAEKDVRANFVIAGDRDAEDVIEGLNAVDAEFGVSQRRWLTQHCLVINAAQVRQLKKLGLDATTCVGFVWGKGDVYAERAGAQVLRDMVPLNRLIEAGLNVGCGSDWGPKNAWENIALAQTFEFAGSGRRNDTQDHVVTRERALAGWTGTASKVMQWDGLGSLATGNHADLIVVDRDPLTCRIEDLPDTKVHMTMVDGRIVHDEGVAS